MSWQPSEIARILKSLIPVNNDDLTLLRHVLYFAQLIQKGTAMGMAGPCEADLPAGNWVLNDYRTPGHGLDIPGFLSSLTEEAKRYFHGLVDALEIHQSIHGHPIAIQSLTLSDNAVYELKQIRDMCLDDGLLSVY